MRTISKWFVVASWCLGLALPATGTAADPPGFSNGQKTGWAAAIDSLTITALMADCNSVVPSRPVGDWHLRLNGQVIGSATGLVGCTCNSVEQAITITDPALLALWRGDGTDVVEAVIDGFVAVGHVTVTLSATPDIAGVCVFDGNPTTSCGARDLCTGPSTPPNPFPYVFVNCPPGFEGNCTVTGDHSNVFTGPVPAFGGSLPPGWDHGNKTGWEGSPRPLGFGKGNKSGW